MNTYSDQEVIFGELSEHPINMMDTLLNSVFYPLVCNFDECDWGVCEEEQRKDFKANMNKFNNEMSQAQKSIHNGVEL